MIASHVHDALAQVKRLRMLLLEKRKFTGYSGSARLVGGVTALLASCWMASPFCAKTQAAYLTCWAVVLFIGLASNYGALLLWFIQLPASERKLSSALPVIDSFPALLAGGVFSIALLMHGQINLLFGTWMCFYGLTHTSCRSVLPKAIWFLGWYYLLCGSFFLLGQEPTFTNPLLMGAIFFAGELAGATILYRHKKAAQQSVT